MLRVALLLLDVYERFAKHLLSRILGTQTCRSAIYHHGLVFAENAK